MDWGIFFLGFITGIGSIGFLVLVFAMVFAVRGHRAQQEIARNTAAAFQDIVAKAGTAAMMDREGGNRH